jgi:hypothetical protein
VSLQSSIIICWILLTHSWYSDWSGCVNFNKWGLRSVCLSSSKSVAGYRIIWKVSKMHSAQDEPQAN